MLCFPVAADVPSECLRPDDWQTEHSCMDRQLRLLSDSILGSATRHPCTLKLAVHAKMARSHQGYKVHHKHVMLVC